MKLHKMIIILTIASLFLMIAASDGRDSTGSGKLAIDITCSKPLLPEGVTNLWVTFTEILAHRSGDGWESLPMPQTPYTIDLMQLSYGGITELVQPVILVSGEYTQIRLVLAENGATIKFDDDEKKYSVVIPPDHLKTDKNFIFDIGNSGEVDIIIYFDLSQSLVLTDEGSGSLSYKLKPVLHIVDAFEAAIILGAITDQSFINFDTTTANITFLANGEVYTELTVERDEPNNVGFSIFWLVPNQDYVIKIDMDPYNNPGTNWKQTVLWDDFEYGEKELDPITIPTPS